MTTTTNIEQRAWKPEVPVYEPLVRGDDVVSESWKGLTPLDVIYLDAEAKTSWLVEDYLPESETLLLYGESHVGKTYIALDFAFAVATGDLWLGRHRVPRPRPVIYIPSEGRRGLNRRIRTLVDYRLDGVIPKEGVEFYIYDRPFDLAEREPRTLAQLAAYVRKMEAGLVVVDVLSDFAAGVDENSRDFGHAFARLRDLPCAVLAVHHSGKDAKRGARGHSSLKGAADVEVFATATVLANPDGTPSRTVVNLQQTKNRNEDKAPDIAPYIAKPRPDSTPAVMGIWALGTATSEATPDHLLRTLKALSRIDSAQPEATGPGCSTEEVVKEDGTSRQNVTKTLKEAEEQEFCTSERVARAYRWKLTIKGLKAVAMDQSK